MGIVTNYLGQMNLSYVDLCEDGASEIFDEELTKLECRRPHS